MGAQETDGRAGLGGRDEMHRLQALVSRVRELESQAGSVLHEVTLLLEEGAERGTMANPRRAQQLLGTAHNALQGARACLDRRIELGRAAATRPGSRK